MAGVRAQFPDRVPHHPDIDACALLDYPLHPNPGDHMLFLAALLWLSRQCDASKIYLAHRLNFSKAGLTRKIGNNPIFCLGGGNLGDLWPNPQRFRESVVRACADQPITLLPQCVYFRDPRNLERARMIFNEHPQLTVMVRDPVSLGLAREHFGSNSILTPDQAVLLADVIPPRAPASGKGSFFLCRGAGDPEAARDLVDFQRATPIPAGNWESMGLAGFLSGIGVYLNAGKTPAPESADHMPNALWEVARKVHRPGYVVRSWRIVRQSIRQLDRYALVITDRFHGHILCAIRNIPHVVVGNNHHKIRSHWEQWMSGIPDAAFVQSPEDLAAAMATVSAVSR
jgi:exopolysaccharide biosynthesis predicted pyruvyltransferase EpsI